MLFWIILKVGVKSLLANKLRSILAMLGIIIGVAAVIAMLAMGSGAQKQVMDRFTAMGTNLLTISPGQRGSHGVVSGTQQNLTLEDAQAIIKEVKDVTMVAPGVQGGVQLKYLNKNTRTNLYGTAITYFTIRNMQIDRGRAFSEGEVDRTARVAVIGPTAAKNVFGENDPLNETVKVNGINFKIVGITKAKGDGWGSPDDRIIIPYTTAMQQIFGIKYLRGIDIQAADGAVLDKVQADVTALLRKQHRLQPNVEADFEIRNMAEIRDSANQVTSTFKYLLGGIAAISLLVGGIGIMNIMLVTVTERTREIGVRKAIGATEGNILAQFLAESVIISGLGGLIGLGLGVGISKMIPKFSPMTTLVDWSSAILAIAVAASIGIFFGFYPAWRAAQLDPIEALRHE
ncbi:MAG: ABC transporter permease [Deltaproteobacteria bacterium]|nr:ABC transporter permease [Deltaproteobacteria bacterium]